MKNITYSKALVVGLTDWIGLSLIEVLFQDMCCHPGIIVCI